VGDVRVRRGGEQDDRTATRAVVAPSTSHESADALRRVAASGVDVRGPEGGVADDVTTARLESARDAGGAPLDGELRRSVESATGASLGGVRVHDDPTAHALADDVGAAAFTVGEDVFFGRSAGTPGSPERAHVLAHELGHAADPDAGGGAPVVRRLLTDEARRAFTTAKSASPAYEDFEKDVDEHTKVDEQKKLTKLHGFFHSTKKETDQDRALADAIRAVVLKEFAARTKALDEDGTLAPKKRAEKRKQYVAKAGEFRDQYAVLTKKGPAAHETRAFLAQHGLGTIAEPTKQQTAKIMVEGPRIEVRATSVGRMFGMNMRAHLCIVYTTREGKQYYFRGGPDRDPRVDPDALTMAEWGEFIPSNTPDFDPAAPTVTIAEGPAAADKLDKLIEATEIITPMKVPYVNMITPEWGNTNNPVKAYAAMGVGAVKAEGENCNATAWTILTRAGLKRDKPAGLHPGWGSILGSHTPGKQNAVPKPEVDDPKKQRPYRIDADRDRVLPNGTVQVFMDRGLVERQTRVAEGTQCSLLDETPEYRKLLIHGKVGYVARADGDHARATLNTLAAQLRESDFDLDSMIADGEDDPMVERLAQGMKVPAEQIVAAARLAKAGAEAHVLHELEERLARTGQEKLKKLLVDAAEREQIAHACGAQPHEVINAAVALLKKLDYKDRLAAALGARAATTEELYELMNDLPDFKVLQEIASSLGKPFIEVLEDVFDMHPEVESLAVLVAPMSRDQLQSIMVGEATDVAMEMAVRCKLSYEFVIDKVAAVWRRKAPPPKPPKPVAKQEGNEAAKKLALYVDIPPKGREEAYRQWWATSPDQIEFPDSDEDWAKIEERNGWIALKTKLDPFPVWIRVDDLKRFCDAWGLTEDEEDLEEAVLGAPPSEAPPPPPKEPLSLDVYVDMGWEGKVSTPAGKPEDIQILGVGPDYLEVSWPGDGSSLYVKKDEYEAWIKHHGRPSKDYEF